MLALSFVVFDVPIQQTSDHLLIGYLGSRSVPLKELDTPFAKGNRHLDTVVAQYQLIGRGQKITGHFNPTQRLVLILYLAFHKPIPSLPSAPMSGTKDSDDAAAICESYGDDSILKEAEAVKALFGPAVRQIPRDDTSNQRTERSLYMAFTPYVYMATLNSSARVERLDTATRWRRLAVRRGCLQALARPSVDSG
jgi:hypothetical protein